MQPPRPRDAYVAWSGAPWQTRVAVLRRWAEHLERGKYDLAIASLLEIGKSRTEALGEAEEAIDLVRYYCGEMELHDGYAQDLSRAFANEETASVLRPLGVFGVISPFNYPVALAVNMLSGALITGNTVVFKPSPGCALSAHLLLQSIREAGVPNGVVNLVAGGDETGRALVSQSAIAGIAFTGSHAAGMAIFRTLANAPTAKVVIAEMGGKNPAYVTARANLDVAAQGVARSAFGLQGQKCSSCSVVYVEHSVRDEFVTRLTRIAQQLKVGNPEQREVFIGPVYTAEAAQRFRDDVEAAGRDGKVDLRRSVRRRRRGRRLRAADAGGGTEGPPVGAGGAVPAASGTALLRRAPGRARGRQCRPLRADGGHLHH